MFRLNNIAHLFDAEMKQSTTKIHTDRNSLDLARYLLKNDTCQSINSPDELSELVEKIQKLGYQHVTEPVFKTSDVTCKRLAGAGKLCFLDKDSLHEWLFREYCNWTSNIRVVTS